jgi:hypothetical protein
MRKSQWIQLLQFIAVWVLIYLFCAFVIKQSFVDLILKHRFFFLVASVSYFYYYSIQYELEKKYELIRKAVIYWNLYLLAHIFFRPLLHISDSLFLLLWLIILWFWWTTKMKSRRKYLLQGLWLVFSFFILISWTLYFYPDKPDIEWFLASRNYEISAMWVIDTISKRDAYIQIDNWKRNEEYEVDPWFVKIISESCEISYPSSKSEREEMIYLMTPWWEIFWIFPQSKIQLNFEWNRLVKLSKLTWKIGILSWIFDEKIELVWDVEVLSSEELENLENLQEKYKYDLVWYLKNQISESNIALANGTIMYDIDGRILRFLAKMFPASFGKNLKNYSEFMYYFWRVDQWEMDLWRYSMKNSWWTMWSMLKTIKEWFKHWKQDTYLLKKY